MAYRRFTLEMLEKDCGLVISNKSIELPTAPITPSQVLLDELQHARRIPHLSEKARSEWVVAPIFRDLHRFNNYDFNIYSGYVLNADKKRKLNGECDFLLTSGAFNLLEVQTPIFTAVEAKRNEIEEGLPQAAAQMLGAYVFNQKKGSSIETIYGASTNAFEWIFLKLEKGTHLTIDTERYYLNNVQQLLSIFQGILKTVLV